MKRDGSSESLWQNTLGDYQVKNSLADNNTLFDVIIAGGGVTGITTGLLLQKKGMSVLIVEAQNIGFGTTGGTTAHLNTFMDTPYNTIQKNFGEKNAQLVALAIKKGLELIRSNVKEYKIDCGYRELPGYLFSQDENQSKELEEIFTATHECNVQAVWTERLPVPVPFEKAINFPGQAGFHPTCYLHALANAFENAGGILLQQCRVTGIKEGNIQKVNTTCGDFRAKHFLYATHIPPGVNLLHFRCAPYRSYAMAIKLKKESDYPEALVYDMYDPYHYYRTQHINGESYFIAGGEDHKTGYEKNTENCFRKLEAYLREYFPVESVVNRWSSQYFEPVDGLPYIGHLPGHKETIYTATGYGGNGMTYSAVAALILADIISTGQSEFGDVFNPGRIKMVAGFSNFMKNAADVTAKLIGKVFPTDKLNEASGLAPGEAKVIKYKGHKLAIYKDEKGKLYALNPACTHIQCDVEWNNAEKSWDCPCHGSRFSYTGEMLTAPARRDLESIKIRNKEKVS